MKKLISAITTGQGSQGYIESLTNSYSIIVCSGYGMNTCMCCCSADAAN